MAAIDEDQDHRVHNLQQPHSAMASETLTVDTQISDHQQQQTEDDPEELEHEEPEQTGTVSSPVPPPEPIRDTHITITIPDQDPVAENPPHQLMTDTHVTITIPDQDPLPENPPLTTPTTTPFVICCGAAKRKKPMPAKKLQALTNKVKVLLKTFKPIPFLPNKSLDFSTHEKLLKRLGLWDFVHLEFHPDIRTDLVAQLVVNFNPQTRCSYINGIRIRVSRANLARALKLPGKKDKSSVSIKKNRKKDKSSVVELEGDAELVSDEAIAFVEDFVSNWFLLHEDTWILPNKVLNWTRDIKEGHPEKVDWAKLMWFMVEKEVAQGSRLGHCYYASHLQWLIESQREGVFAGEPLVDVTVKEEEDAGEVKVSEDGGNVKMSEDCSHVNIIDDVKVGEDCSDVKMAEDGVNVTVVEDEIDMKMTEKGDDVKIGGDGADVKMGNDGSDVKMGVDGSDVNMDNDGSYGGHELEEPNIELSLGQDSFENEQLVQDDVMDFEESKEEEQRQWLLNGKNNVGEHFLQQCNQDRGLVCVKEEKQEEQEDQMHAQEQQEDKVDDHEQQEDQVHEHEQQEGGFTLLPNCNNIEAMSTANLIQEIEASQVPYSSSFQLRDLSLMHKHEQQERGSIEVAMSTANLIQEIEASQVPYSSSFQLRDLSLMHKHEQQERGSIEVAMSTANLIQEIEASQVPYSSPLQLRDLSLMEQFTSRGETNPVSGGPSIFGNVRREIDHEHEITRQPLNVNHKRLRINEPWEQKSSDFDLCMENVQLWMGKAKMFYQAKEQNCTDLNVNQEMLMNELQKRDHLIAHLHKLRFEEQQKSQVDTYRLERELFGMGDLLKEYRKALKETRRAFSEYRARCPLPDKPLYKDVPGSGGLVLSATDMERYRLKQEEEERIKRLEIESKVKEFEADFTDGFEEYLNMADMLNSKLLDVDKEVKLLKDFFSGRKGSLAAEHSPNE